MPTTPPYFTNLPPFRELFAQGVPVLMYHKLGPRPPGVRLKGLYVDVKLFTRQLGELREAGFRSVLPGAPPSGDRLPVCLTFDDGYVNVLEHGLRPLADHGFRAIQYIVAGELGGSNHWDVAQGEVPERLMDAGQIREWLAAGHAIGSHSLSHAWLTRIPPAAAREEIGASRKRLEDLFGIAIECFCYPYGDWNPQVREWVREAGYKSAVTTGFGVNGRDADPLGLKRILVRYRSRSPRSMWRRLHRG